MHPTLKKLLIFFAIVLGLFIIGASVIAYMNEDRIRELVITQINDLLETEAKVDQIEFSLLSKFPKASIRFTNVKLAGRTYDSRESTLLEAKSVFLEFDPFDLLTGTYVINEIQIENGKVHVIYFDNERHNYDLIQRDSTGGTFELSLEKVGLSATSVHYENFSQNHHIKADLNKMILSGSFDENVFDLDVETDGKMQEFVIQSVDLRHAYAFGVSMSLTVNRDNQSYTFEQASLMLGDIRLRTTGHFIYKPDNSTIELGFKTNDCDLTSIYDLLPEEHQEIAHKYNLQGKLDLEGKIKGSFGGKNAPELSLKYTLNKGSYQNEKAGLTLDNLHATGTFTNGPGHRLQTSLLKADSVFFNSNTGNGHAQFSISDFNEPLLELSGQLTLELDQLKKLIKSDSLEILTGSALISIQTAMLLDSAGSMSKSHMKTADISGKASLKNAHFKWTGMQEELQKVTAELRFYRTNVTVDSLNGSYGKTGLSMEGKLYNLLPYLFFKDERLKIAATINLDELNVVFPGEKQNKPGSTPGPIFTDLVEAQININAKKVRYRKFEAADVSAELKMKSPMYVLQDIRFNAMDGLISGWLQLEKEQSGYDLSTKLTLEGIDIQKLFYQCEEFGQQNIVSENLKGQANVGIEFGSKLKDDFSIVKERIHTSAHLEILNGELINYKPAMALSKYVDIEELRHIKFSRLVNEIEIINEVVYIPEMEVKSSALELKLSGKHSFKNEIEYHFQLWLNDFLFRKAKRSRKNQSEFGDIESDESGRAKLFIRMEGTVDDYSVKLDRRAMRKVWNENLIEERNEINQLLKEEFKGEKSEKKQAPKNFQIEWEGMEGQGQNESDNSNEKKQDEAVRRSNEKEKDKKPKWYEKAGEPIKDEYQEYDPDKLD